MATNIFLGNPPENIKQFIIENYGLKEDPMLKVPLHFTAEQDSSTISLVCYDIYGACDIYDSWCEFEYSMTGKDDWNTYDIGSVVPLNKGETVYFRAKQGNVEGNPNLNGLSWYEKQGDENYGDIYYEVTKYHVFKMEGSIKANGNIQFLLDKSGTIDYVRMYGYSQLFKNCIPLTQAPLLPATTLAIDCYYLMFEGCTSLTQAPALPATAMANSCYSHMFYNCTSLTRAPELPATTLANHCYSSMFQGCTSLTQAPELPAETLAEQCYYGMFNGCLSLNNVNVSFTTWNPSTATLNWLNGVASTGTFTCPESLEEERGTHYIPKKWTRVNK